MIRISEPYRNEVVQGMSWSDYCDVDGCANPSRLVKALKSMKSFANYTGTDKPDRGMLIGSLTHQMILEPGTFEQRYAIFHASRKTQKQLAEFEWRHEGKTPVKPEEYEQAMRTADAVLADPLAREKLQATVHEVTVFAEDHGVQCKGRIDAIGNGMLVDLKTTTNVEPDKFGRVVGTLHYGAKMACYMRWSQMLHVPVNEVFIIAVETKGDYDVAIFQVPEIVLQNGWNRVEKVLKRIPDCVRRDYWPGVGEHGPCELVIPSWSMSEDDVLDWSD